MNDFYDLSENSGPDRTIPQGMRWTPPEVTTPPASPALLPTPAAESTEMPDNTNLLDQMVREHVAALGAAITQAICTDRDERRALANRRAWSGPSWRDRQIARAFGLPVRLLIRTPPSALDARYSRRYRNRQGR